MSIMKEFKEFAIKGNVVDLAVGIIIGGAFGTIVKSLVDDVLMPPVGLLIGKADFANLFVVLREGAQQAGPYASLAMAKQAGAVTINLGIFINAIISFTIMAFAVFMLVRLVSRLRKEEPATPAPEPDYKTRQYCLSNIPLKASRCPHCTSQLAEA